MAESSDEILKQYKKEEDTTVAHYGRKLKVGIIGTGWIAETHVQIYKDMPDVEIVATADLIPGKAEEFCRKWGVEGARCAGNARVRETEFISGSRHRLRVER